MAYNNSALHLKINSLNLHFQELEIDIDFFFLIAVTSDLSFSSYRLLLSVVPSDVFYGRVHKLLISVSHRSNLIIYHCACSQLTELFSTTFVLHLANKENSVTSRKVLCIIGTSLLHIIAGSVDQFIQNVFLGEGKQNKKIKKFSFHRIKFHHQVIYTR